MEYVNNDGLNPYTMRRGAYDKTFTAETAWPHCYKVGRQENAEVDAADFSDMLECEEKALIDELDPDDYDLDGPEYDSDYDFDGEVSDTDSEMDENDSSDPGTCEMDTA